MRPLEDSLITLGYTEVRTPLLQPMEALRQNIHAHLHPDMVKLTNLKGQIEVLRYDNTRSVIEIARAAGHDKVFTHEPQYAYNFSKSIIEERWCLSAEWLAEASPQRDSHMIVTLYQLLQQLYGDQFILEFSNIGCSEALCRELPSLFEHWPAIEADLERKNLPALSATLEIIGFSGDLRESLLAALSCHGPIEDIYAQLKQNPFKVILQPFLNEIETITTSLPDASKARLHFEAYHPPKLTHYNGLHFQAISTAGNQLLARGGAYRYPQIACAGIGFVIFTPTDSIQKGSTYEKT